MSNFVNKFKEVVGFIAEKGGYISEKYEEDVFDELYGAAEEEEENFSENPLRSAKFRKNNLNVVTHPGANGHELMVVEPRSFEESLEAVNNLRSRKSLILNLHLLDATQSQRVVDFVSGATHAIDGHQQKVGEGVFVFTPKAVNIAMETEKTRVLKDAFWKQA